MMAIAVSIPDELTKYSEGRKEIEIESCTIGDVLQKLFAEFPNLQMRLVDENRHFYPYVPAFLNDEKLALSGTLNRRLQDGDRLSFMVIASGG